MNILQKAILSAAIFLPSLAYGQEFIVVYGPIPAVEQRAAIKPWIAAVSMLKKGDSLKTFNRLKLIDEIKIDSMFSSGEKEATKHLPIIGKTITEQDSQGFPVVKVLDTIAHDHFKKDGGPYQIILIGDPRFDDPSDPGSSMKPWSLPNVALTLADRTLGPLSAGGRSSLNGTPVLCVIPSNMGNNSWQEGMRTTLASWVGKLEGKLVLFSSDYAAVGPALASNPEVIPGTLVVPAGMKPELVPIAVVPQTPQDLTGAKTEFFSMTNSGVFDPTALRKIQVAISWDKKNTDLDLHGSIGQEEVHHIWYSHKSAKNGTSTAVLNTDFIQPPSGGAWERIEVINPQSAPKLAFWVNYFSGDGVPTPVRCRIISWDAANNVRVQDLVLTCDKVGNDVMISGTR